MTSPDPSVEMLLKALQEAARASAQEIRNNVAHMAQHPLRPSHPDFVRLTEVIQLIEGLRELRGTESRVVQEIYDGFVDTVSASYMGANRSWMNVKGKGVPSHLHKTVVEMMTNAWVEGMLVGIYFQQLGGHRPDPTLDNPKPA